MLAVYKWDAARGLLADITPGWWPIFGSQWSNRRENGRELKALSTGDFNGDSLIDYALLTVRLPHASAPSPISPISRPILSIRMVASIFFTPRLSGFVPWLTTLDPFSERTPR